MRTFGKASAPFKKRLSAILCAIAVLTLVVACRDTLSPLSPIQEIKLDSPLAQRTAQLSGLAWYDDWLILLPQYPDFAGGDSYVYGLPKSAILDYLAHPNPQPLTPQPILFDTNGFNIFGSQGFEAIAFAGQQAFFTIEAAPWGQMRGYLLRGEMAADMSRLQLDTSNIVELLPQSRQFNMAYEAILVDEGQVMAFYELNGTRFNRRPRALVLDRDMERKETAVLPNIPHRITDVTGIDEDGRFWAINYLPRGLNLLTPQPIWWQHQPAVEQLIELQIRSSGIIQTTTPPIDLHGQAGRNWEGVVRFDDLGFLLATDNHPQTMLGFVASN